MSASSTTTTMTTTTRPTAPAWDSPQAAMRDFRCFVRRRVDSELGELLTPKTRRMLRDAINRALR